MCDAGLCRIDSSLIGAEIGGYIDDALNWAGPSSNIDHGVTRAKNCSAVAAPIPELAPVMMAVFCMLMIGTFVYAQVILRGSHRLGLQVISARTESGGYAAAYETASL